MNSNHEYFEELCALAALGELSADEVRALHKHLENCASCSLEQEHYVRILRSQLPLTDVRRALLPTDIQVEAKGYRERFLARARKQGFRFSSKIENRNSQFAIGWIQPVSGVWRFAAVTTTAFLVFGASVLFVQLRNVRETLKAERHDSKQQNHALARPAVPTSPVSASTTRIDTPSMSPVVAAKNEARARQLKRQLAQAVADRSQLQSSIGLSAARIKALSTELQESRSKLEQTMAELRRLGAQHANDTALMAAQESNIADLRERISTQSDALEREQRLLAVDRDIRDVMTARSLHIIDVHDVDSGGNVRNPFGRAFYTDRKSLIFYAYDLPPMRNVKNAHSFQAWGYKEPSRQQAQSLGIFYVDDKAQNRWVLKVDDAAVLAQIDAVFVTIEPPGGSGKPTGKRLLYAYLNGAPNHP